MIKIGFFKNLGYGAKGAGNLALGALANPKTMKMAQKTLETFGNTIKEMEKGNLQRLLNSFLELINSPMIVALDITIAKLTEKLMPTLEPIMNDIASGKYDQIIDLIVEVFVIIQKISFGPLIKILNGIMNLIEALTIFGGNVPEGYSSWWQYIQEKEGILPPPSEPPSYGR